VVVKRLTHKQFTVITSGNGANITKNTLPTATIVLGENGLKETTKLVRK
jgi:anthranilate phosphoribosyltransferase